MKKFLLVPDSFKGTLSSKQICDIMSERILEHFPLAEVISIPVADGGEGKMDHQSLQGKVISGVARRAKEKSVPVVAVVGGVEGDVSEVYGRGVTSVFSINRLPEDFSVSRYKSEDNLSQTMDNIIRILKI